MAGGTQENLSPWTSGSWNFDPRKIGIISPNKEPQKRRSRPEKVPTGSKTKRSLSGFGLLPEQELLRLGYIALFAFSGFVMALLAITLLS
ncbi:MAG: hypothetical protein KDD60_03405 [Bdellovibrionales bacterium]|nr:hypothetical protein [Bdellovibrionales bacterium]